MLTFYETQNVNKNPSTKQKRKKGKTQYKFQPKNINIRP